MSEVQQQITTNAFHFSEHLSGNVDPRTGAYCVQIQLGQIIGSFLQGPELALSIRYHFLSHENFGFGRGWIYNLSRYDRRARRLYLGNGQSYHVQPFYDVGILEMPYARQKDFQARAVSDGRIQICYKDGLKEFLNPEGIIERLENLDGRALVFEYHTPSRRGRIKSISDGHGQSIQFAYDRQGVQITQNGRSCLSLRVSHNELNRVTLADHSTYQIAYESHQEFRVIKQLTHPLGACEVMTYDSEGMRAPDGSPNATVPAVSYRRIDGDDLETQTQQFVYSRTNYLGFAAGARYVRGRDNLFERDSDYQYSSTEYRGVLQITRTYNRFHLLVKEETFDTESGQVIALREVAYGAEIEKSIDEQPSTYALPVKDKTTYKNESHERSETHQWTYDAHGNVLTSTDPFGMVHQYEYYPAHGTDGCPASPSMIPYFVKTKKILPSQKYLNRKEVVLTHSYQYHEMTSVTGKGKYPQLSTELVTTTQGETISTRSIKYHQNRHDSVSHGRIHEETLAVGQRMTKDTYQYAAQGDVLSCQLQCTLSDGLSYQETIERQLKDGARTKLIDRNQVVSRFEYDLLGRCTREITRADSDYQHIRSQAYSNEKYWEVQDEQGRKEKYTVDALGRVLKIEKTNQSGELVKHECRQWNKLGQLSHRTLYDTNAAGDEILLKTQYEYDAWGEVKKEIYPSGLSMIMERDKAKNTCREYLLATNGDTAMETMKQFDELGHIILQEAQGQTKTTRFDGLARLIEEQPSGQPKTMFEYDSLGRCVKESVGNILHITRTYDPNSLDEWVHKITVNHRCVGERTFDGLGRVVKESIHGCSETQYEYATLWGTPTVTTQPDGGVLETRLENTLGEVLSQTSSDGVIEQQSTYSKPDGLCSQIKNGRSERRFQFNLNGNIAKEQQDDFSFHYEYSRQGEPLKTIDYFGQRERYCYDAFGRLSQVIQSDQELAITYDAFDRVKEEKLKNRSEGTWIHQYEYDKHARVIKKVSKSAEKLICQQSYSYNAQNKLSTATTMNEQNQRTCSTYQYDVLGRLISFAVSGPHAPLDQAGLPIQSQTFQLNPFGDVTKCITTSLDNGEEKQETLQYQYSKQKFGQLESILKGNGERKTLAYDENGNLIRDEEGQVYQYNMLNQMTAVLDANEQTIARYFYDGAGLQIETEYAQQSTLKRFYAQHQLTNELQGGWHSQLLRSSQGILSRTVSNGTASKSTVMITDHQHSPIREIENQRTDSLAYQPYGKVSKP
ncbi:RHS repeat domain-containing protein [Algicola sagamiensis]|uniref:RHS repeat protein n=1 Tax=Algicola sagamiensis TaxID=163869 RepID=UPI000368AC95|nr:RHS repeat protein [Algicola sagamiensis]